MFENNTAFIGSIPEYYDRYMGPVFFEPYAADLVRRLKIADNASVLELACGTGVVTQKLREHLPPTVKIVATDLNQAMLDCAGAKFAAGDNVELRQADATELPFDDHTFDAVICQFGLMFMPDKKKAVSEAHRMLKPGGIFLFNTWDKIEDNDFPVVTYKTLCSLFSNVPPTLYETVFSLHDTAAITSLATSAGFKRVESAVVTLTSTSPSANDMAHGLVEGTPMVGVISERSPGAVAEVVAEVAKALASEFGDHPLRGKMQAIIFEAVR